VSLGGNFSLSTVYMLVMLVLRGQMGGHGEKMTYPSRTVGKVDEVISARHYSAIRLTELNLEHERISIL